MGLSKLLEEGRGVTRTQLAYAGVDVACLV